MTILKIQNDGIFGLRCRYFILIDMPMTNEATPSIEEMDRVIGEFSTAKLVTRLFGASPQPDPVTSSQISSKTFEEESGGILPK